jgi:hypothetical protein
MGVHTPHEVAPTDVVREHPRDPRKVPADDHIVGAGEWQDGINLPSLRAVPQITPNSASEVIPRKLVGGDTADGVEVAAHEHVAVGQRREGVDKAGVGADRGGSPCIGRRGIACEFVGSRDAAADDRETPARHHISAGQDRQGADGAVRSGRSDPRHPRGGTLGTGGRGDLPMPVEAIQLLRDILMVPMAFSRSSFSALR